MEKNIYTGEILYVAQNRNLIKELKFNEIGVRVLMKFKKLLALMMVCMFVLTGCNKTNKKYDQDMQSGQEAVKQESYEDALDFFDRALVEKEDDKEATSLYKQVEQLLQVQAKMKHKLYDEAIELCEKIMDSDSESSVARDAAKKLKSECEKLKKEQDSLSFKEQIEKKIAEVKELMAEEEYMNAKVKLGWLHTDFSRVKINEKVDFNMWDGCDYIVSVSDDCKKAFDDRYRNLKGKSIVIENILTFEFVEKQSKLIDVTDEIVREDGVIIICSIGRFSKQKNFDNVPNIAKRIIDSGILIKWYLIGYGIEEKIIKKKIMEEGMENNVFILGKKSNPYPYIKACDIYVQPSRFEGKAVTVREAQMLNKPVVITNFKTAKSQLEDGVDGIIVPMDNKECASGIISLINNNKLREGMINNTKIKDYSNKKEIYKLYNFIK